MNVVKEYIRFINRYIKENTIKYCIIVSAVFVLSALLMFFVVRMMPKEDVTTMYNSILEIFDSKNVTNGDGTLSFWGILINNLRAGVVISTMGFIPFLFLPILYVALNSGLIGAVMGVVDVITQQSVVEVFIKYILPHGVFEIPALILEGVIGAKICMVICKKIFGKEKEVTFLHHLKGCLGIFVVYVLPMTIVAAFIEAVVLDWLYL